MADDDDDMLPEYDFTGGKRGAVVCTHGQLKRQCEICGLESQVAFWHDEVNRLEAEKKGLEEVLLASTNKNIAARELFDDLLMFYTTYGESWNALKGRILAWLGRKAE